MFYIITDKPSPTPPAAPPLPSAASGVKASVSITDELHERSALLDSISTFNKSALRKVASSSD